eukprot:TRINITY_DN11564_c0_g1_i1.p1 TRINITY_DN11564_c0_g1~~TRINITY_DN11564_c0_g1_i1.p1  ORF type:complete len:487 (+),score=93.05 TRINITY_DN11564_c0_g1_i1:89-1462(+)
MGGLFSRGPAAEEMPLGAALLEDSVWRLGVPEEQLHRQPEDASQRNWLQRVFPSAPAQLLEQHRGESFYDWLCRAFPQVPTTEIRGCADTLVHESGLLATMFVQLAEVSAAAHWQASRKYARKKRIGEGAQGQVWRADGVRGDATGKQWALKDMYIEKTDQLMECWADVRRLQDMLGKAEARGHVMQYNDVYFSRRPESGWPANEGGILAEGCEWRLTIAMDFATDGDLAGLLDERAQRRQRLPEATVLRYGSQLASALMFMHRNRVLHMDVKPENVLLFPGDDGPNLRLTDFDASRQPSAQPPSYSAMSSRRRGVQDGFQETMAYCAPEVARDRHFSEKGDVFSLGVVLYCLLTPDDDYPMVRVDMPGQPRAEICMFNVAELSNHQLLQHTLFKRLTPLLYLADRAQRCYSRELIAIICGCLNHDHMARTGMEALYNDLQSLHGRHLTGQLAPSQT